MNIMLFKLPLSIMLISLLFGGQTTPSQVKTTPEVAQAPIVETTVSKPKKQSIAVIPTSLKDSHTVTTTAVIKQEDPTTTTTTPVAAKPSDHKPIHNNNSSAGGFIEPERIHIDVKTTVLPRGNIWPIFGQFQQITWDAPDADYCEFSRDLFKTETGEVLTRVPTHGSEIIFIGKSDQRGNLSFAETMITAFGCAKKGDSIYFGNSIGIISHMFYADHSVTSTNNGNPPVPPVFPHDPDPRPDPIEPVYPRPRPKPPVIIDDGNMDPHTVPTNTTGTAGVVIPDRPEPIGYIAQWYGKYNQKKDLGGQWQTDPTYSHGAETSPLDYCKTIWPQVTRADLVGNQTIPHWIAADMQDYGSNTKPVYTCMK